MDRLRAWSPFLLAVLFYVILLATVLTRISSATHGQQLYLLDDAWLRLTIAKNLLLHGVYGISPTEPAMASSSILWPFLLAAVGKVFGLSVLLPLILNILFALALLAIAQYILIRSDIRSWIWQTLTLLLLVLAFPLVAMTLDGMEHVLYGFAFLVFLRVAGSVLNTQKKVTPLEAPGLLLCALLLTSCRYEGIFAVFITCLLLLWRSRALSAATAIAGLLPILAFGIFSHSHGGMWLPNPVVVKTLDHSLLAKIFMFPLTLFSRYVWVCGLAGLVFLVYCAGILGRRGGLSNIERWMIFIYLGAAVLHVQFARLQTITPRYESYLIGAGILLASTGLYNIKRFENEREKPLLFSMKLIATIVVLPLIFWRGVLWQIASVDDAVSVYRQQYQAAQFFARFYPGQPIAVSNAGTIAYFTNSPILDLSGLASNEIAAKRADHSFTTKTIEKMAADRDIRVAFANPTLFTGKATLPQSWISVATWTSPETHGDAPSTFTFYATSPEQAQTLLTNLKDFQKDLPSGIILLPNGDHLPV